ncbi:MAG: hypothetical protein WCK78_09500, partial [Paludibacter sp.]
IAKLLIFIFSTTFTGEPLFYLRKLNKYLNQKTDSAQWQVRFCCILKLNHNKISPTYESINQRYNTIISSIYENII